MQYHINPKTGRPNICRAHVRACPIAGPNAHFSTEKEAVKSYEASMQKDLFPSMAKESEQLPPLLESRSAEEIEARETLHETWKRAELLKQELYEKFRYRETLKIRMALANLQGLMEKSSKTSSPEELLQLAARVNEKIVSLERETVTLVPDYRSSHPAIPLNQSDLSEYASLKKGAENLKHRIENDEYGVVRRSLIAKVNELVNENLATSGLTQKKFRTELLQRKALVEEGEEQLKSLEKYRRLAERERAEWE